MILNCLINLDAPKELVNIVDFILLSQQTQSVKLNTP